MLSVRILDPGSISFCAPSISNITTWLASPALSQRRLIIQKLTYAHQDRYCFVGNLEVRFSTDDNLPGSVAPIVLSTCADRYIMHTLSS